MTRILVAIDGSPDSFAAAELAATLARARSSQLELVFVIEPGPPRVPLQHADTSRFEAQQRARGEQILAQVEARLDVKAVTRIEHGDPAERLCSLADSFDVILVLAGSRGHHSILRGLIGSASQRLMRDCAKTVVIVRSPRVPA